ncbi:MAG: DMT family transporter [Chthoniobacterales bacterium]
MLYRQRVQTSPPNSQISRTPDFSKGYAAIFGTIVIWSTPSLFLFYLNRFYDPFAQNFYRYAIACLAVLPFLFRRRRISPTPLTLKLFFACVLPAIPNVIHQVTQVLALNYIGPGVFTIFMRSSVIITALLALVFFPEERWIIRHWRFQTGTVLGLLGAIGVLWFQPGWETGAVALRGFLVTFVAAFCWALYGVFVKRPSAELGPVRSFALVSLITSVLLFVLTIAWGNIRTPLQAGAHVNFILIFSAVTSISLAHVLYYIAIRELGVALAQTLQLLCPLGALVLSYFIFGERLTTPQIWSAALLLFGAFLAVQIKPARTLATAENL